MKRSGLKDFEIHSLQALIHQSANHFEEEDQQEIFMAGILSTIATIFDPEFAANTLAPMLMEQARQVYREREARKKKRDRRKTEPETQDIGPNITRTIAYDALTKFSRN